MRLLFIHARLADGGITSVLINRMNYLVRNADFEIHFLSETFNDVAQEKKLDKRIVLHNLNLVRSPKSSSVFFVYLNEIKNYLTAKKNLSEFLRKNSFDIITTVPHGTLYKILPSTNSDSNIILEFHISYLSNHTAKKRTPVKSIKVRLRPDRILFPREEEIHNRYDYGIMLTKEDFTDRGYLTVKKELITNPISIPDVVSNFKVRPKNIIAVGRLSIEKNFIDLIKAAYLIKDKLSDWKIKIYGKGHQEESLKIAIDFYGLNDIIALEGYASDMDSVYNNSKLLISTSLREGLGMNILEALSYDIPVISYDCKCGPKEIIRDGVTGYLIKQNPEELAEKIARLIESDQMLDQFSSMARNNLAKFEYSTIMNNWREFYTGIFEKSEGT